MNVTWTLKQRCVLRKVIVHFLHCVFLYFWSKATKIRLLKEVNVASMQSFQTKIWTVEFPSIFCCRRKHENWLFRPRLMSPIRVALDLRLVNGKWSHHFPSRTRFPRGFHTNARKTKYITSFWKMYLWKTKKALDSIRRQKYGAHLKASLLLLRIKKFTSSSFEALNSMVTPTMLSVMS